MKDAPLANINMAQNNGEHTAVIEVNFVEPDHRHGVCVSLEEWAARIFKPNSAGILRDAKLECKNTKHRFEHSKKVTRVFFIFTERLIQGECQRSTRQKKEVQNCAGVATSLESSPDHHQEQSRQKLLYNISCGIKLLLKKSEENSKIKKKNIKKGNRMITQ
jgi:hypothetical protein